MADIDVFNGDADGLCALHQLRLAEPRESLLISGIKRDVELLKKVEAQAGDRVTVLDISLDVNRSELLRLLEQGASVEYFDHHFAGEIPHHPGLTAHIDTAPEVCSSLLVDRALGGRFRRWAVTAAFGDNLHEQARIAAQPLGLSDQELTSLEELGTCLNYNGYGIELTDLWFPPDQLYREISPFSDPVAFVAESPAYRRLREGYLSDLAHAESAVPTIEGNGYALFALPDEPWVRRISGELGNMLARRHPERAHAILTGHPKGGYRVSVRAPITTRRGADELCRQFPSGGGRQAAAGINRLPEDQYGAFIDAFKRAFPG